MSQPTTRRSTFELLDLKAVGTAAVERVVELPVTTIAPNPDQPRRDFPPDALKELADSIKKDGLQQPIIVREAGRPAAPGGADAGQAYELIMGERRLRACQIAGLKTIRAIIRKTDDTDMLRLAIVENIHREDLSLIDQANAFCKFKDQFHDGNVDAAAQELKISRATGFNYKMIGSAKTEYQALIAKHGLDVRGSKFLLTMAVKVAKECPEKTEAFEKEIGSGALGIATLKRLHDDYFPTPAEEDEKPLRQENVARKAATAIVNDEPYRKTKTEVVLELRFDPRKAPPIEHKLRAKWAKAVKQFLTAAGYARVEIDF